MTASTAPHRTEPCSSLPSVDQDPEARCQNCGWIYGLHGVSVKELRELGCDIPDALCPVCGNPLPPEQAVSGSKGLHHRDGCPPHCTPDNIVITGD